MRPDQRFWDLHRTVLEIMQQEDFTCIAILFSNCSQKPLLVHSRKLLVSIKDDTSEANPIPSASATAFCKCHSACAVSPRFSKISLSER
jgi:hypothetical protein